MDFLCKVCDKSIIENESNYINYIATLKKERYKSFYENYIIINPNLDEVDKILNDCITSHNKKLNIYFINCEFNLVFDNYFKIHIENNFCFNIDNITKIKSFLIYSIDYYKLQGYGFCNINEERIIKTISDECNITYKHYIDQPMQMVEIRLNFVFDIPPQLINALDCSRNHPLIRKYSHIRANNI